MVLVLKKKVPKPYSIEQKCKNEYSGLGVHAVR